MPRPRLAIFGASGFVGSALVERLFFDKGALDFKAFIHSSGNAARLTRLPIALTSVDVLDLRQVREALAGCTIVVNCLRGEGALMLTGLRNIIRAARDTRIQKFIHIGSMAIYGSNPSPETASEDARPDPGPNTYGIVKLKQDELVFRLHASGLPAMVLCPSNISGPYSPFVLGAARSLLSHTIALVDDGQYPTNLVHVDNLVEAILRAAESDDGWGERYFVNELEQTTWSDFYATLQQLLGLNEGLPSVPRHEVLSVLETRATSNSIATNLRRLMSKPVRDALATVPVFGSIQAFAAGKFAGLHPDLQAKVRRVLNGPTHIPKDTHTVDVASPHVRVQVRQVFHSPTKIISRLKYVPLLDYHQRWATTARWFDFINLVPR